MMRAFIWLAAIAVIALGVSFETTTALAQSADPDPAAQTEPNAPVPLRDSGDGPAEAGLPMSDEASDDDTTVMRRARWFIGTTSWLNTNGVFDGLGGAGLFALFASLFLAFLALIGGGLIIAFKVLDQMSKPRSELAAERLDAILSRR